MKCTNQEDAYKKWSKKVIAFSIVFIAVIVILSIIFVIGIYLINSTDLVFRFSIIAVVVWCVIGYFVIKHMEKAEKNMREQARRVLRPDITSPLYKEIFDEYEYNRLERFTNNIFFHRWKLQHLDDYNNIIDVIFEKGEHEIAIDFSDEEISIIIDEETDSPTEIVLKTTEFNSADDAFNRITAVCRNSIRKQK